MQIFGSNTLPVESLSRANKLVLTIWRMDLSWCNRPTLSVLAVAINRLREEALKLNGVNGCHGFLAVRFVTDNSLKQLNGAEWSFSLSPLGLFTGAPQKNLMAPTRSICQNELCSARRASPPILNGLLSSR